MLKGHSRQAQGAHSGLVSLLVGHDKMRAFTPGLSLCQSLDLFLPCRGGDVTAHLDPVGLEETHTFMMSGKEPGINEGAFLALDRQGLIPQHRIDEHQQE